MSDADIARGMTVAYSIRVRLYNDGRPVGLTLIVKSSSLNDDLTGESWEATVYSLSVGVENSYLCAGLPQHPLHSAHYTMNTRVYRSDEDWMNYAPLESEFAVQADYSQTTWRAKLFADFAEVIRQHYIEVGTPPYEGFLRIPGREYPTTENEGQPMTLDTSACDFSQIPKRTYPTIETQVNVTYTTDDEEG